MIEGPTSDEKENMNFASLRPPEKHILKNL